MEVSEHFAHMKNGMPTELAKESNAGKFDRLMMKKKLYWVKVMISLLLMQTGSNAWRVCEAPRKNARKGEKTKTNANDVDVRQQSISRSRLVNQPASSETRGPETQECDDKVSPINQPSNETVHTPCRQPRCMSSRSLPSSLERLPLPLSAAVVSAKVTASDDRVRGQGCADVKKKRGSMII